MPPTVRSAARGPSRRRPAARRRPPRPPAQRTHAFCLSRVRGPQPHSSSPAAGQLCMHLHVCDSLLSAEAGAPQKADTVAATTHFQCRSSWYITWPTCSKQVQADACTRAPKALARGFGAPTDRQQCARISIARPAPRLQAALERLDQAAVKRAAAQVKHQDQRLICHAAHPVRQRRRDRLCEVLVKG